ncbi:phytoene desaturase family protein [Granulicella cerasi]|uniref:Phytoene desaturase family protein n=1 Tax=Granulicella cerasi TaxID=741063 RepID=A0ABW1ZBU5_9BACT|nr:NAD(P)/FAD-dependent oxidoreductase [Granulicella cerasi]
MALRTANIIGSGPNGLAAAITLAQAGVAVTVHEQNSWVGGACSTAELTLPGFKHDRGASIFPLGVCSPFLASLPLHEHGLDWIEPDAPLAHPFDDGSALMLEYSIDATVARMPGRDVHQWRHLIEPIMRDWTEIVDGIMQPLLRFPEHPFEMLRFGLSALRPAKSLAKSHFRNAHTQALFAGCAAHSTLPMTNLASSAAGLVLAAAAHTVGWPLVRGGAGELTKALASYLRSLGGEIVLESKVTSLAELPPADATFFDTTPEMLGKIAGDELTLNYRDALDRFRRGMGIFKIDWALSEPIPWRSSCCKRSATVHVGGSLEEITHSEYLAWNGGETDKPFVLLAQPSLFDASRAPEGKHTAWAYCHVPAGARADRTEIIERQVERFAPGFRDTILARTPSSAAELSAWNPNLACGDIAGGAMDLKQMLFRPTKKLYRTSHPRLYLCSASTPPGGGVHGMAGYNAAMAALHDHGSIAK